ncbi:nitrate reductase (quinol-dependent) transmembrane subunit [Sinobacterium caligoides]|uniref:Nitrate reductase (Quinol-dependent) transmembrane subunit n=1 Tax=Sinobacterium caligoides TaxID=933926 RepID=A0A3N2DQ50_9GAMM|nr:DmsC/YnfH family molybdoenzyme membrane anchor subunit [Sinobacterium caligoides]ROS01812.1 nitrate reductase (quinol-dependent) transmembrane subunit [Sinobacterium caligoides]
MFKVRDNEPKYALLNDPEMQAENTYGLAIDLLERAGKDGDDNAMVCKDRSMGINGEDYVGDNPNRNKQHAFHFTADNCIGCHACEAACSEKNDNPAHLAFRSVGYVEGGTYPDFRRMNISMACNHCDNPVCLKGCPTKAYTKHVEYGAVLQDPETCFGCGYCTWVCPYNAPQLDPIKGQVSKCNMCVDRLEVGLKPACVAACLGNALNFGVVENTPENRTQAKIDLPGFPDTSITSPNIRFQQVKSMPDVVTRTDGAPVKYQKQDDGGYQPVVDQKKGKQRFWNLERLSSRENPLVVFTIAVQMAIGGFIANFIGNKLGLEAFTALSSSALYVPFLLLCLGLVGLGLLMTTIHLGKPMRFYRGFNNLRYSPVCREGLGIMLFMVFAGLHMLCKLPENAVAAAYLPALADLTAVADVFGGLAIAAGLTGLYYMYRCYRIKARPFWDHWQTATSFIGTAACFGGLALSLVAVPVWAYLGESYLVFLQTSAVMMVVGMALEALGLFCHANAMNHGNHEGGASHYVQCTTFGKTYMLRNALLVVNALLIAALAWSAVDGVLALLLWGALALSVLLTAVIGRALFYVLVIPTTMPGGFFWKNKDFEQHARDIGLADMPQVGVVPLAH